MKHTHYTELHLREEIVLPTRVQLFSPGDNRGADGVNAVYDPTRADEILAASLQTRSDIPIDISHLLLDQNSRAEDRRAVGWGKLVCDETGVWVVDIEWTPEGAELLRTRAFRYVSPAFYVGEDSCINRIVNFALTNNPATLGAEPIVREDSIRSSMEKPTTDENSQCERRELDLSTVDLDKMTPEEIRALAEQLINLVLEMQGSADSESEDPEEETEGEAVLAEREQILNGLVKRGAINYSQRVVLREMPITQLRAFNSAAPVTRRVHDRHTVVDDVQTVAQRNVDQWFASRNIRRS